MFAVCEVKGTNRRCHALAVKYLSTLLCAATKVTLLPLELRSRNEPVFVASDLIVMPAEDEAFKQALFWTVTIAPGVKMIPCPKTKKGKLPMTKRNNSTFVFIVFLFCENLPAPNGVDLIMNIKG